MNAPKEILHPVFKQLYPTHSQSHAYSNIYFSNSNKWILSCFVRLITKDKAQLRRLVKSYNLFNFLRHFLQSTPFFSYTTRASYKLIIANFTKSPV
ncbi:hypothetical protein XELAEV_18012376mg [Xenopus laevis]|uniref:Uncharacterized protein n=1 Tax=Xenopus laevis TaxID=8355 RepID=A0A974DNP4_XENLA|nr:hypothetical protein XELAEV_18012376mg [Xenopus laevis]